MTMLIYSAKPDTVMAQGCVHRCENLVSNGHLEIDNVTYPITTGFATKSFQRNWVKNGMNDFWHSSHNSPHHVQYQPNNCNLNWTQPNGTEVNCISSNTNYTEGIFTNINSNGDPLTDYCITLNVQNLQCGFGSVTNNVELAFTSGLTPVPESQSSTTSLPSNQKQIIHTQTIGPSVFNVIPINASYTPNGVNVFNQFWIYSYGRSGSGTAFTTINNVNITCTTRALTGINLNQNGNTINPIAINSSEVSTFESYVWDFGDGNTSTEAEPTHTYQGSGPFRVCVDIVDNNGCCANICQDIILTCEPPEFYLTAEDFCPIFRFSCIGIANTSAGDQYSWVFGDGQTGSGKFVLYEYTQGGPYTVRCTVKNQCGLSAEQTINIFVDLPVPSFTVSDNCPSYTFTAPFVNGYMYLWDFGDGSPNGTGNMVSHSYNSNGTKVVKLTVTNSCGSVIITQNVEVNCNSASCINDPNVIVIGQTGQTTFMSTLFGLPGFEFTLSGQIRILSDKTYNLKGNLIIDVPTKFSNSHVFCDPGSSVSLASFLQLASNSVFEGCDTMWKGISNFGYNLAVTGQSRISDAEWAISVGNGSTLNINSAIFRNNIVGIQAPLTNQKSISYGAAGSIKGSTFIREGLMKPLYPGQIPYIDASIKGIAFNNVDNLVVLENDFIDIHEGIYANNTRVLIKENTFTSPNNLGIRGVYLQNLSSNSNKIGDNNTFDNIPSPINIESGILGALEISNNQITYNNSSNFVSGIRCSGLSGSNFYIENNNRINIANGVGIDIGGCQFNEFEIKNSIIEVLKGSALNISWVTSKRRGNIFENQLRTDGDDVNVWLEDVTNLDFIENNLTGDARYSFHTGDVTRCVYRGNQISQTGVGHSFFVGMSPQNTYCCNHAPNLIMSLGGNNEMSDLRNNTLSYLNLVDAIIGPQINAGNIWEGSNSIASISASAGGTIPQADLVQASPFIYDPMQTGGRPVNIAAGGYEDEWFIDAGTHVDCGNEFNCGIMPYPGGTTGPNGGFMPGDTIYSGDTLIIIPDPRLRKCEQMMQALLTSNQFVNGNRNYTADHSEWNMQMILNRWIDIYGLTFWSQCLGSVLSVDPQIKEWYDAEKERDDIRQPYDMWRIQYDNKAEEMGGIYDQLASMVYADPYNSNPAIDVINADLHVKMAELQNIVALVKAESKLKAQNFYAEVSGLPVRFGFLAERKLVWALEGKIYLNGIESLSSYEWNQLKTIANMCPYEIGAAVYEARNLLRLTRERDFNDDQKACKTVNPRSDEKEITDNIRVYPNPSDGRFRIEVPQNVNITSVVIYNMMGTMERRVDTGQDNSFDLTGESSGIYYYECMDGTTSIHKGKLLLIK